MIGKSTELQTSGEYFHFKLELLLYFELSVIFLITIVLFMRSYSNFCVSEIYISHS